MVHRNINGRRLVCRNRPETTMIKINPNTPEQFAQLSRSSIDASLAIAKIAMESAEQLARLQMDAVRKVISQGVAQTQALAGAKDTQDFAATRLASLENGLEQVAAYSRTVYEVSTQAQGEIGKVLENRYSEFNRGLSELVDEAAKSAPAGSEPAVAMIKQSMAASNQVIDALAQVVKQVSQTADANVKSAAGAAAKTPAKKRAH